MMLRVSEIISEGLGTAIAAKVNGDSDAVELSSGTGMSELPAGSKRARRW